MVIPGRSRCTEQFTVRGKQHGNLSARLFPVCTLLLCVSSILIGSSESESHSPGISDGNMTCNEFSTGGFFYYDG
jgi:hypothetical protein